jgi:hypothetical protein
MSTATTTTRTTTATLQAQHEAAEARRIAEEAQRKADEAQQVADAATEQARQEADARLQRDAEKTISTFDADLAAATTALHAARDAFYQQAVVLDSLTGVRDRYIAWQAAALDLWWIHRGLQGALGRLGRSTFRGVAIPSASLNDEPPTFSKALDDALARAVQQRNAEIEDRFHERILAIENGVE